MEEEKSGSPTSAFDSPTFGEAGSFYLNKPVGSASISPCGRDIVLASRQGLHIIDLDSPWSPPRDLAHHTPWEVADVQWSPFAAREYWVVSTSNQKALVWNLAMVNTQSSIEHILHAHTRAITDINFSAHHPDILATCAVDSFVHCWDLRHPGRPSMSFSDWFAGATQVKWNRQNSHILASSHDKFLRIWDDRKGAYPLRSIQAHDTKIYGVDWNRVDSNKLATCSLDKSIKFWNYERQDDTPEYSLQTPFPVWRARYTPFGFGMLAMPQRGDYNLHLYDRRNLKIEEADNTTLDVHQFEGHDDQVKEFLWRPRGNVTDNVDDREFQLVSWGTDRILYLHQVDEDVLGSVGYEKGVNRNFNVTRKNAVYKTFRIEPTRNMSSRPPEVPIDQSPHSALTAGMSKVSVLFANGYGAGGFMSPMMGQKKHSTKETDPIAWMRGVRIGKREPSPTGLHRSVSSVASGVLTAQPSWDVFESLGDEITHVGEKFRKVKFDKIDVPGRMLVISLSGPWASGKNTTYIKARIDFPASYPDAAPSLALEKTSSIEDETVVKMCSDTAAIASGFVTHQRSSLEAILRFLLGEQSLDESLHWLKKRQESTDLDSTHDLDLSSSDEDDETFGRYTDPQAGILEASETSISVSNAQYNVPLPKACGAFWADDGRLVCFFPPKLEKAPSTLDLSLKSSDRSSKYRRPIFEGFGRLQSASSRSRHAASTLETIESDDSDYYESTPSSSDSSSSSEITGFARHHFMPNVPWHGDSSEMHSGAMVDESQKSSGDSAFGKYYMSNATSYVALHDLNDILPTKQSLARNYIIGNEADTFLANARAAKAEGDFDLADIWSLVDLIMQRKVPLDLMQHPSTDESILFIARQAGSHRKPKDRVVDLSFDASDEKPLPPPIAPVKWGDHPFGRRWFVNSLLRHFERKADVQMLAMLSCALIEHRKPLLSLSSDVEGLSPTASLNSKDNRNWSTNDVFSYYPSRDVAIAQLARTSSNLSVQVDYQNIHDGPHSGNSSTGPPLSDLSTSGTPPTSSKPLRMRSERRESQAISLSTSPEQIRHTHRSSSNLSALAASFKSSFPFTVSAASSPPRMYQKKRLSPVASYLGTSASSSNWNPSEIFGRHLTITEDPKSSLSLSLSDTEEGVPRAPKKPTFTTKLKNQDQFQNDGYADVPLLDPAQAGRYNAYREAYAHLLYIWDIPLTRAEILKYNNPESAAPPLQRTTLPLTISKDIPDTATTNPASQIISFRSHCSTCSRLLSIRPRTKRRRCSTCSSQQRPLLCLLCNTYIQGLSSPCLHCGHVLHKSCREILFFRPLGDVPAECLSGCGCNCGEYSTFNDIPPPDLRPPPLIDNHDLSPTVTVVGHRNVSEQEQSSWLGRHNLALARSRTGSSILNRTGERQDVNVAYESLTRNLQMRPRLRGEENGGGSGGNFLRERSSQIWRGRRGSRS